MDLYVLENEMLAPQNTWQFHCH